MTDSEKTTAVAVSQSTLELDEKRPDPGPHPGEAKKKSAPETQLEDEGGSSRPSSVHTNLSDREPVENLELGPVTTGSSVSPSPVSIPMSKRRGLLAQLALVPEVEEPKHYPRKTKWFITFVIGVAAMAAPMGSAIFFPALGQVAETFNASPTITNLSVALYMLSMGVFPLWWSSFSEKLGRRTIYLVSFALFVLWSVLSAIASSIGMLIVMRLLGGGASASVQAVGAGTIADIWEVKERGRAMGIFYLGPLCGPLLAPIIGGVLSQAWDWRSTQWFLAIYGGVGFLLLLFGLPETLPRPKKPSADSQESVQRSLSRVSSRQVVEATAKWLKLARIVFIDPLGILLYLRFPAVLLTVYYGSIAFGSLYILNISVQDTFSKAPYNFSMLIVGLLYIPNSLGYIVASLTGGPWMDRIMQREARRANRVDENGKLIYRPEDRMRENAWLGAILYPVALIVYGWTAEKGVYWIVPIICNFFFGLGSMIIFSMSTTMLTEFMPKKSSSGVAVNNFARNTFSCIGGIVTAPIIHGIGNGWLFTIIGLVALASCSVIWAMKKFGPQWRVSMDARLG
ncbi:MFS multidrug transporter [Coccidioides posadasii str. Silveira]|uniref:Citrate exporter 1 n=1 Tax=Coccidioides posadasii (strain RMSCC 757 / Silveira) TaxID=443226 RepID=E9DA62_COCPS|nr:MFS multidrug transporter [Coccidioides posadasii str. Silveira]